MIITIGGKAGSGKSTIAKQLAKKLNLKHYSIGDLQRGIAKEKGITLMELSKLEEENPAIDKELDEKQKELGKKEDNFVIDGRLSAFFIPNSIKIFLDADEKVRAERILKDERDSEKNGDIDETIKNIKEREESEKIRYKKYYGFDCYDESKYDIIIDSSNLTVEEIINKILKTIKK